MQTSVLKTISILFIAAMLFSCGGKSSKEAQAHFKMGVSHLNVENIQLAYIEFQKSLELDPNNKEVHNALGNVHLRLSEYKKAEDSFKKAVRLDSKYSEAHNNLCYLSNKLGEWEKAVKHCKKALENTLYLTPEKAYYNLGMSYMRLGKYDESIDAFTYAIRRFQNLYPAYYGLALVYNEKKLYGEAAASMKKAIEIDPRFKGDRAKAEATFRPEIAIDALERKDLRSYLEILKY